MKKLKPCTNYRFTDADLQFVVELAKVGHVHLLSNQVFLTAFTGYDEGASMNFKEHLGDNPCDGLQLPFNWVIEWLGCSKGRLSITFGVKNK